MAIIVHKYGGTSMGSVERIKNVARRVAKWHRAGYQMVVVVSAMSGETNRLIGLAKEIMPNPDPRELDVIASTGEQVSIGPVTEWFSVGQVEKREPPQTRAPGARVPGQPWQQWDCDVKKRRKVPFPALPANSSAAFAARRAPAAAARASLFLNSSCSSVSARSGSSGRRQTRSICGALGSRKLSEKRSRLRRLARSFGKRPEELERANSKAIASPVVLPGLAEADEAEGPARASADREVAGQVTAVQVGVLLASVNDLPRALAPVV